MAGEYRLVRTRLAFHPNDVLTASMLEALDKFPHEVLDLFYQHYQSGIVTGLDFNELNGHIILSPGIARLGGTFYMLDQELDLTDFMDSFLRSQSSSGKSWNIVLTPGGSEKERGVPREYLRFECSPESGDNVKSLQLAGFTDGLTPKLPQVEGSRLVDSFLSSSSLYLLDTPIADVGEVTFPPLVFTAARNTLMAKKRKTPPDLTLLFSLSQKPWLSMLSVKNFIQIMGGTVPLGRRELFREFFRCLQLETCDVWVPRSKEEESTPKKKGPESVIL